MRPAHAVVNLRQNVELAGLVQARDGKNASVVQCEQRRVPPPNRHVRLSDPGPGPARRTSSVCGSGMGIEGDGLPQAVERVVLLSAAAGEQPAVGQERMPAAKQVHGSWWLAVRCRGVVPDGGGVLQGGVAFHLIPRSGEEQDAAGTQQCSMHRVDDGVVLEQPPHAHLGSQVQIGHDLQHSIPTPVRSRRVVDR